jgi:hypothetical protein
MQVVERIVEVMIAKGWQRGPITKIDWKANGRAVGHPGLLQSSMAMETC